jgi:lysophospholipase L1-like esterase
VGKKKGIFIKVSNMSDQNLWVAGLLTLVPLATGTTSANATSPLSDHTLDNDQGIENFATNELDVILKPAPIVSMAEVSSPEFSSSVGVSGELDPALYLPNVPQETLIAKKQPTYNSYGNFHQLIPKSGAQLYQQRQTSLRAGKLYTKIDPSSFQSSWLNAKTQPSHEQWKKLLAQEAKVMSKSQGSNRLNILLGDSLTLWLPTQGLSQDKFWLNQGISGEHSSHVLSRLNAFAQTKPNTIYLMAGINDLRNGKSDYEVLSNMRKIMKELRLHHPQADVVVQSILPTRMGNISNIRIQQFNNHLQNIAQQEGAHYLNLYPFFTDAIGNLNPEYTTDGLHLSPQGYAVWQSALQQTDSWLNEYHLALKH